MFLWNIKEWLCIEPQAGLQSIARAVYVYAPKQMAGGLQN
jgi:hypothetical protein